MNNKYEDIIHLPHHKSQRHKAMSLHDRAAQFAPFAALNGFEEEIDNQKEKSMRDNDH